MGSRRRSRRPGTGTLPQDQSGGGLRARRAQHGSNLRNPGRPRGPRHAQDGTYARGSPIRSFTPPPSHRITARSAAGPAGERLASRSVRVPLTIKRREIRDRPNGSVLRLAVTRLPRPWRTGPGEAGAGVSTGGGTFRGVRTAPVPSRGPRAPASAYRRAPSTPDCRRRPRASPSHTGTELHMALDRGLLRDHGCSSTRITIVVSH
jgi:hypothetical protein